MYPYAQQASQKLGGKIPPEAILAQWGSESENGKKLSGAEFNYAGIKAGKNDKKGKLVYTEEYMTEGQIDDWKKQHPDKAKDLRVLEFGDKIIKGGKEEDAYAYHGGKGKGQAKAHYDKTVAEKKKMVAIPDYFASFDNFQQFTDAYVKFLSTDKYKKARNATTSTEFGASLGSKNTGGAGYSTTSSQDYSKKLSAYVDDLNKSGIKLNQSSQDLNDQRKALDDKVKGSSSTTNIVQQSSPNSNNTPPENADDRNAHDKKKGK